MKLGSVNFTTLACNRNASGSFVVLCFINIVEMDIYVIINFFVQGTSLVVSVAVESQH